MVRLGPTKAAELIRNDPRDCPWCGVSGQQQTRTSDATLFLYLAKIRTDNTLSRLLQTDNVLHHHEPCLQPLQPIIVNSGHFLALLSFSD